uniref:DNA topoisomerase 2-binding protein 1 n=1 Tax=Aegilops tauschii TaxID=37682 RepID=M8AX38_AEGTA
MDGVTILCSGFEKDERARIEQLVTAMGGLLQTKVSMDVNFVVAKDVLAAKYKWAVNSLKKPIVNRNWLEQCWIEHRVVPHEPYRILPFTGLNICITKLDAGNRILRELFLTCYYEPGGDKYLVAKKWGNIHIVDRRWVDQSVARRAYLDESAYVIGQSSSNYNGIKGSLKEQRNPMSSASFQSVPAVSVDDSVSMSQYAPVSSGYASKICNTDIVSAPCVQETNEMPVESHVAEDSEAEDDDLYLSNCRISLVGFEEKELSRCTFRGLQLMMLICLSREKKEVRRLAAWGVINVVKVGHLQDVGSHPIFSPLRCRIPFPGFEDFRFCVSQYDEKERVLLKNLCLTLGAKFTEKASKRVNHLICKFASGPKYEAYHNKRIPTITTEWLFECVRQDTIIPYDQFQPKPPTSQDKDAVSLKYQEAVQNTAQTHHGSLAGSSVSEEKIASSVNKRRRSGTAKANDTSTNIGRTEKHSDSSSALGVADSIKDFEDLLAQSSRDPALDASVVGQDEEPQPVPDNAFTSLYNDMKTRSNNWPQKQHMPPGKNVKSPDSTRAPVPTPYLPFSETQTDSQIIGYEEDLTGMQKIIDRVSSQKKTIDSSGTDSSVMGHQWDSLK